MLMMLPVKAEVITTHQGDQCRQRQAFHPVSDTITRLAVAVRKIGAEHKQLHGTEHQWHDPEHNDIELNCWSC